MTDTNIFAGYRKIKHWQGYGVVGVQKVATNKATIDGQKKKRIVIKVKGCHEYGIKMSSFDTYGIYTWLLSRYDKSLESSSDFSDRSPKIKITSDKEDGIDVCYYEIIYNIN